MPATVQEIARLLYACATVDYFNQTFFDTAFLVLQEQQESLMIGDLGLAVQACAILRRSEYKEVLVNSTLSLLKRFERGPSLKDEFAFV